MFLHVSVCVRSRIVPFLVQLINMMLVTTGRKVTLFSHLNHIRLKKRRKGDPSRKLFRLQKELNVAMNLLIKK